MSRPSGVGPETILTIHDSETMSELFHRVKIFVYRLEDPGPAYLLTKPDQGFEALWGPLQGNLGFGEQIEGAVRRRILEDTGMRSQQPMIDLEMPAHWQLGDEQIIEWNYGVHALSRPVQETMKSCGAAFRWVAFGEAYPSLDFANDRAAIMRLHTMLAA